MSADTSSVFARSPRHHAGEPPAVGDWVAIDRDDDPTIHALLPRRSALTRAVAGREARAQVLAANVDVLLVVAGLDGDLNLRRLERYLVLAASSGVKPIVLLNKADVHPDPETPRAAVAALGVDALLVSAQSGTGIEEVRMLVPEGTTAALVGSSGVGKSSIANRLLGEEQMEIGALRKKDKKGRHTTTARYLLSIPGAGILLDTPGIRELALWDAEEGVAEVFADIEELARACKFSDCRHDTEPGCAVRANVSEARMASWRKLQREAASNALRADHAAARAEARKWGRMGRDAGRAKQDRLR